MSDEMNDKYQKHYNQILSGTISDVMMKNVSYQANIKLANEIISEQEKTIVDSNETVSSLKKEIESLKSNKISIENAKITSLENTIKTQSDTISKLNSDLFAANKSKSEFESFKSQASNVDIFRKELIKERENHDRTRKEFEEKIQELNEQIDALKAPPKRKKTVKKPEEMSIVELVESNEVVNEEQTDETTVKDGGTF